MRFLRIKFIPGVVNIGGNDTVKISALFQACNFRISLHPKSWQWHGVHCCIQAVMSTGVFSHRLGALIGLDTGAAKKQQFTHPGNITLMTDIVLNA